MNEIYERYKDEIEILCVYIQEAHPTDGWQVVSNVKEDILYAQPKTEEERAEIAGVCVINLDLKMPVLLDGISNEVDTKYAALPERLYVLDRGGIVTFASDCGPIGFDVDAWEKAIREVIEAERAAAE